MVEVDGLKESVVCFRRPGEAAEGDLCDVPSGAAVDAVVCPDFEALVFSEDGDRAPGLDAAVAGGNRPADDEGLAAPPLAGAARRRRFQRSGCLGSWWRGFSGCGGRSALA